MIRPTRFSCRIVLAAFCVVFLAQPLAQGQLRPNPAALEGAPRELIDRLRADAFTYFRLINRAWTARVCEAFADVSNPVIVRLHGDAHVEQFALTKDAWGLDDFDDSTRGPAFVDIVRFLGSIDLVTRQRGWTRDRDALWDRFLEGYRRGLADPEFRPAEPAIVRRLRDQAPVTRRAYLDWGERQMEPMTDATSKSVIQGMEAFERFARTERRDLAAGYFNVVRAGWLRIGVGSASARKVLIRVQGPTIDPDDDVLIEAKEVANLGGLPCLEDSGTAQAIRVIDGTRQIGRLKHEILAVGPTLMIPAAADSAEHFLDSWVSSWEPEGRAVVSNGTRGSSAAGDIQPGRGVPRRMESVRTPLSFEEMLTALLSGLSRAPARLRTCSV